MSLGELPARHGPGTVHVVVESPRGSRVIAVLLSGKEVALEGWEGREAAERLIEQGIRSAREARAARRGG